MAEKETSEGSDKDVSENSSSDSEEESDEDLAVLELIDGSSSSSEDEEEQAKSDTRHNKTTTRVGDRPTLSDDRQRSARINRPLSELVEENTKVKRYHNTTGSFVTGIDVLSKESREKRTKRAERFGIPKEEQKGALHGDLEDTTGVLLPPGSKIDGSTVRLEAIYLTGVDDMSTKDIFNYFKDFMPSSVEWIDDTSCNVVWLDPQSASRALVGLSQAKAPNPPSPEHSTESPRQLPAQDSDEEPMEEDDEDVILDLISNKETGETERVPKSPPRSTLPAEAINTDSMQSRPDSEMSEQAMECLDMVEADMRPVEVKSKDVMRIGKPHPKADDLWMRFACADDRKQKGAYKHSQYYLKYGNPSFGGYKGLVSLSKRKDFRDGKYQPDSGQRKRQHERHERWDEEDEEHMYPRKRKTRRSDEEETEPREKTTTDLRDRLKKGSGRRRPSGSDGEDSGEEDGDSVIDEEAESLNAQLRHAMGEASPKRKMQMYADQVEEKLKQFREESEEIAPLYKVRDAREGLNKRLSVRDRLGHIRGAPTPASSLENLKIIVDTQDNISERSSSSSEGEEEGEESDSQSQSEGSPRSKVTGPLCQKESDDLRGWLHSRETSRKLLAKLPSLKIEVQDDT